MRIRTLAPTILSLCLALAAPTLCHAETHEDLVARIHAYMSAKRDKKWDLVESFQLHPPAKEPSQPKQRDFTLQGYVIEKVYLDDVAGKAIAIVETDGAVLGFTFKDVREQQHWVFQDETWMLDPGEAASL